MLNERKNREKGRKGEERGREGRINEEERGGKGE
jgi:hypothetical protein